MTTGEAIVIREATTADAPVIADLIRALEEVVDDSGEPEDSSPVTPEYVRSYLAYPDSYVLVAEEAGQVVGLLSYSIRPNLFHAADSALIEELIVDDRARGRGVGSALMRHLLALLEARGCAEVSVSTMPDNHGAIRFYHSHGLVDEAVFLEKHF
jgi:ribosomal protein S18 acetylase RimI-like enzyme